MLALCPKKEGIITCTNTFCTSVDCITGASDLDCSSASLCFALCLSWPIVEDARIQDATVSKPWQNNKHVDLGQKGNKGVPLQPCMNKS